MEQDIRPDGILSFTVKRNVINLFKEFLVILENLEQEHEEALTKLAHTLPPESQKELYLADHFTDEKMERLRKQVLSRGNDTIRSIEEQLKQYDIKFKG